MAIDPGDVAVVLLAAGQSRRFGADEKLLHSFRGKPLVLHAALRLAAIPFGAHVAVAGKAVAAVLPKEFCTVENPNTARGLSSSIGVGVTAVTGLPVKACLIALGDMPLVPAAHFEDLLRSVDAGDPKAMVATCSPGGRPMVPALFGEGRFEALRSLSGDEGARALLAGARTIACDPHLLLDLDRPSDFAG